MAREPCIVIRSVSGARRSGADGSVYDQKGPRESLSSRWIEWGVEHRLGMRNSFLKNELWHSTKQSAGMDGTGATPRRASRGALLHKSLQGCRLVGV